MESDPTKPREDNDDLGYWLDVPAAAEADQEAATDLAVIDRLQTPISEYIIRAQQGDEVALKTLMGQYEGMLHYFAHKNASSDLPYEDRVQNGRIGFWRAIERFTFDGVDADNVVGVRKRFFVHARWHVVGHIKRGNASYNSSGLTIPEYWEAHKLRRTAGELLQQIGEEPTDEELATELGWPQEHVAELRPHTYHPKSLDEPTSTSPNGDEKTLLDVWEGDYDADEVQRNLELRDGVEGALNQLPDHYANMMRMVYGVGGGKELAPWEIIATLGVTRQAVSMLKKRAHKRLAELLREYVELDETEAAG